MTQSLEDRLNSFKTDVQAVPGEVQSTDIIQGTLVDSDLPPVEGEADDSSNFIGNAAEAAESQAVFNEEMEEAEETEESSDDATNNPEFVAQFKSVFGVEPEEAMQTVQELTAFRDEMNLMSEWNVTPSDYRARMSQVQEFYNGLPEESKADYNTPEGAKAIWNHLSKQQQPTTKATSKRKSTGSRFSKKVEKPMFTKAQIARMPQDEYSKRLPEINQAFREGRVK